MKYYVYISDVKMDMLLPQIPHDAKQNISRELGVDIKLFKASTKSASETEDNRISRLEAVVKYILEWGNLGTVQTPNQYIEDTFDMRFRIIGGHPTRVNLKTLSHIGLGENSKPLSDSVAHLII